MNPLSRAFLLRRLDEAETLADLRRTWGWFSVQAQKDPEVLARKDQRKAELGGGDD